MAGVTTLGFTITPEGSGCASTRGPKHFSLEADKQKCVRIGRAPGNDIQVELRGCSQFHAEIRLLPAKDEDSPPRLVVRDLSMNGTGLKHGDKPAVQTKKEKDVQLYHGAQILVPMQLKQNQAPTDRAWLTVDFDDPELGAPRQADDAQADADAGGGPAPRKKSGGKAENGDQKAEHEDSDDKEDKADNKDEEDEDGASDDPDGEKTRTQFVDLLMKAKEISAGTTYEDAEGLLSKKSAWKAVDEQTRRECFEIFVDHLATHHSGKKKKKKDKAKKDKKRKHKGTEEEAAEEEEDEDAPRKKKKSKKGERRKKARSKSS